MEEKIELLEDFKDLEIFLIGNPKQFIIYQGNIYCIRKECENCPHMNICEYEEELIQTNPIEHPRRGIAFEKTPFLVLKLKGGLDFEKGVPKELWDCEYSNLSLDENNIHYILADPRSRFKVLKGHFRFYGKMSEFEDSDYKLYFDVVNSYEPKHYIMAMDLSSIEPRVSTIVSREPEWLKIFQGTPKIVAKEIEIKKEI